MELRDYLDILSARRWMILQTAAIVMSIAFVGSLLQPKTYEGEARVLIEDKDVGEAILGLQLAQLPGQPERDMQTQVELMQMRPLAERTIRRLGLKMKPAELLKRIEVETIGQTNMVSIKATDTDPQKATDIANTIASEYVAWSRTMKRDSVRAAAREVRSRLGDAEQRVLELGRKVKKSGKTDELNAELQIATGAYTTLAEKLEQLTINEQLESGAGRMVSRAVPNEPVSPKPLRNALLGGVLGLMLGLGIALLSDHLDTTVKSSDETERLLGAPVLGWIKERRLPDERLPYLSVAEDALSPTAESYRSLRNSLDFVNLQDDIKTIMVASPAPSEGKSTIAANLAESLAQRGKKVVLVSCDFRRPTTEGYFGLSNDVGLSQVLIGASSLNDALQRTGAGYLRVLTSGEMPPNPSELLCSERMRQVVESLEEAADWVILDTPPLLAVSDASGMARWTDGVLMVVREGRSRGDSVRKAGEMLEKTGARLIGSVVFSICDSTAQRRSEYGYDGYHAYHTDSHAYPPHPDRVPQPETRSEARWTEPPPEGQDGTDEEGDGEARGKVATIIIGLVAAVVTVGLAGAVLTILGWSLADLIRILGLS